MRKLILCACSALLLCGCTAEETSVETVGDAMIAEPSRWEETACEIICSVPETAELIWENEMQSCYMMDNGQLEISRIRILAGDISGAVKVLSGYEAEQIEIIKLSRFSLPEYRFSWYAQTENGGRVYSADVVIDDIYCYAIVCSTAESVGNRYESQIRSLFSSFGLHVEEGV